MSVPEAFDSLVAKIIVTGADREQALARSRRALAELELEGMPSVVPFHRAVLDDPAFTAAQGSFAVHTRWIETEFDNQIAPWDGESEDAPDAPERTPVVVEVDGRRLEVVLPAGLGGSLSPGTQPASVPARGRRPRRDRPSRTTPPSGDALTSPMQGTIVKVAVGEGDQVAAGDLIVVLEAMKMEQPLTAHRDGTVTGLTAEVGGTVTSGSTICEIGD